MKYDLRINSVVMNYKYSSNSPIISINNYIASPSYTFDFYSLNKHPTWNKYLLISTGASDHEVGLWNIQNLNCDLLLKVNTIKNEDRKPLTIELPRITQDKGDLEDKRLIEVEQNLKKNFSELKKYTYKYNSNYIRQLLVQDINSDYYQNSDKRLNKILSIYDSPLIAQCAISPIYENSFNTPYIFTAGNDMTIRYWDLAREGTSMNEKKSYIFNAPTSISEAVFTKANFDNTIILQSNEEYKTKDIKRDMPGFSEYLNFNGNAFCATYKNEYDETDENLKYCTRIADPSHTSIITDILPFCVDDKNGCNNLLISSSWDGTIKLWK